MCGYPQGCRVPSMFVPSTSPASPRPASRSHPSPLPGLGCHSCQPQLESTPYFTRAAQHSVPLGSSFVGLACQPVRTSESPLVLLALLICKPMARCRLRCPLCRTYATGVLCHRSLCTSARRASIAGGDVEPRKSDAMCAPVNGKRKGARSAARRKAERRGLRPDRCMQ